MPRITEKFKYRSLLGAVIVTALSASPNVLQAQALEEIVVTAQRREQSLQEVPISIETFSGAQIQEQGFRNLEDVSTFSPGVYVQSGVQDQMVSVRGFGTIGNSLTLEQAVPIFLDGVHYGRQSQIKTAFLDVDRVEVLKGPQPVFFGMSASAGAFNIQSKGPTDTWVGDLDLEVGNNNTVEATAGAGGPINDTWGIRVAVTQEESDGFLKNSNTEEKYPRYFYQGGRITLAWTPTENFKATTKWDYSKIRGGSEAVLGCLTGGPLNYGRQGPYSPSTGLFVAPNATTPGSDQAVLADAPIGVGQDTPSETLPSCDDGFTGNTGLTNEGPYFQPPANIREQDMTSGFMDVRTAAERFTNLPSDGLTTLNTEGIAGKDFTDAWSGNLNLEYTMANDVAVNWLTGTNYYKRSSVKDNRQVPYFTNYQGREENFTQWSSELRFTSPTGGTFEWMAGLMYQINYKDNFSSSLRPNTVRGQRFNSLWEDVETSNAFATVTWNFMDDKASLDVGARYSEIKKDVFITGYAAAWVFDVTPAGCPGATCVAVQTTAAQVRGLVPGANTNNLWYVPYTAALANYAVPTVGVAPFITTNRVLPLAWYPNLTAAVGLSQPDYTRRLANETLCDCPLTEEIKKNFIDPTITLRYRLNDDHSVFFRFAEAAKAAGYDTGQTTIPADLDEMRFENELGRTFEVGAKGKLMDGTVRYDATLFRTDFIDLQLSGLAPQFLDNQTSVSLNAGKQRVQGLELGFEAAATDRLTFGIQGAFMDGKMTDFVGSTCNNTELNSALRDYWDPNFTPREDVLTCTLFKDATKPAGTPTAPNTTAGVGLFASDNLIGRTDRSGSQAPRTPDWKFVGDVRYVLPIFDSYEATFIAKGYVSDGFITSRDTFASVTKFNRHGDANLQLQFGPQDGNWKISTYANNIFEARESYNPEYDVVPSMPSQNPSLPAGQTGSSNGLGTIQVTRSNFMTYGLKFGYNFE